MRSTLCLGVLISCVARLCFAQDTAGATAANGTHIMVVRARALIDGTSAQPRQNQEIVVR